MPGRSSLIQIAALLFALIFSAAPASFQQPDPSYRPRLTGVIVEGQQRYKESTIIVASGLVVDKPTSLQDIATAANRLATLGIFKKVRYQYSNTPDEISVLFHVDEETNLLPCVLDNFVWFSDAELIADLREHVPFFDMVLPPVGDIIGQVRAELARFLVAKNIPAQVDYVGYTPGIGLPISQHIFMATGLDLPIRAVHFSGAQDKFLGPLTAASRELMQQDYSRLTTIQYAHATLLPVYLEKGYLRADFGEPKIESVTPSKKIATLDISILIPVIEGRIYRWNGAQWHGVQAVSPDKLTEGLGQRVGDPANLIKFNRGLDAARAIYEKSGYLEAEFAVKKIFEESDGSVSFDIGVTEGIQFRMGELEITGLLGNAAEGFRKAWKLKRGDVFDGSYPAEYLAKEVPPRLSRLGFKMASARESRKLDHENHRVDVTLNF
jgi:outer membrane protein assembly factor BamA